MTITKREGVDLIIVTVSKQNVHYLQLHVICKNYYQSQHFTNNKGLYSRVNRDGRVVLEPENELYSVPDIVRRRRETRQSGQPALHCGDNLLFC